MLGIFLTEIGNGIALRFAEVDVHALVIAEGGSGGADFRPHVGDGAFAGGAQGTRAFAKIFDESCRYRL